MNIKTSDQEIYQVLNKEEFFHLLEKETETEHVRLKTKSS
jgi:hypothetical protein